MSGRSFVEMVPQIARTVRGAICPVNFPTEWCWWPDMKVWQNAFAGHPKMLF